MKRAFSTIFCFFCAIIALYSQQNTIKKQLFIINKKDTVIADKMILFKRIPSENILSIKFITDSLRLKKLKEKNIDAIVELQVKKGTKYLEK